MLKKGYLIASDASVIMSQYLFEQSQCMGESICSFTIWRNGGHWILTLPLSNLRDVPVNIAYSASMMLPIPFRFPRYAVYK